MVDQFSPNSVNTLCIDIGGSHLKAAIVAADGAILGEEVRIVTPVADAPPAMILTLAEFVAQLGPYDRVAVGFPGAIRHGKALTAPNIGGVKWRDFPLQQALQAKLGRPVRVANDATVQGLGVIAGQGVECTLTFGTGMGFAVFENGVPGPHLELSRHPAHKDKNYDEYVGNAEYKRIGGKRWNKRVRRVIEQVKILVNYDTLYLGGGNAVHIDFVTPSDARIVPNLSGVTGGIKLWNAELDPLFA